MQVPEVVDPSIIFAEYSYASSTTDTLRRHFAEMAHDIVAMGVAGEDLVLEFGCNDGVLIQALRRARRKCSGRGSLRCCPPSERGTRLAACGAIL